MKLENQVVSLEYAKKLKELGFKQESLWYWEMSVNEDPKHWNLNYGNQDWEPSQMDNENICSAYTVAELGEMLPDDICYRDKTTYSWLDIEKIENDWLINYRVGCAVADIKKVDNTEASARAKMLIYLKENKLI